MGCHADISDITYLNYIAYADNDKLYDMMILSFKSSEETEVRWTKTQKNNKIVYFIKNLNNNQQQQ